jgi:hypothetical protein
MFQSDDETKGNDDRENESDFTNVMTEQPEMEQPTFTPFISARKL